MLGDVFRLGKWKILNQSGNTGPQDARRTKKLGALAEILEATTSIIFWYFPRYILFCLGIYPTSDCRGFVNNPTGAGFSFALTRRFVRCAFHFAVFWHHIIHKEKDFLIFSLTDATHWSKTKITLKCCVCSCNHHNQILLHLCLHYII